MVSGFAEIGAGIVISGGSFGFATPIGFSVFTHGVDHFTAGMRSLISGYTYDTATSQIMQKAGLSPNTANFLDNTTSMTTTMCGTAVVRASLRNQATQHKLPLKNTSPPPSSGSPATSSLNGQLLKNKLLSQEISGGHAFEKHILNKGEFRGWIRTRKQLAEHIEMVLTNYSAKREMVRNRTAYWHQETGTIVIHSPRASDGGTVFQPREGYNYFIGID